MMMMMMMMTMMIIRDDDDDDDDHRHYDAHVCLLILRSACSYRPGAFGIWATRSLNLSRSLIGDPAGSMPADTNIFPVYVERRIPGRDDDGDYDDDDGLVKTHNDGDDDDDDDNDDDDGDDGDDRR